MLKPWAVKASRPYPRSARPEAQQLAVEALADVEIADSECEVVDPAELWHRSLLTWRCVAAWLRTPQSIFPGSEDTDLSATRSIQPDPTQMGRHSVRPPVLNVALPTQHDVSTVLIMVYGCRGGCGDVVAGEVRGGAAASGRAVATAGVGGRGPLVGSRRDRGGGPGVRVVAVASPAGRDGAGVRGCTVGPGPSAGGGRKPAAEADPGLLPALLGLVEPTRRGDPTSPLCWTTLSVRRLAGELTAAGHTVSQETVAKLLRAQGFSLQGNAKTTEGGQHVDRDAQFGYLNDQAGEYTAAGDPVISVDTKKKELVGAYKNGGQEWHPPGNPNT